MADFPNLSSYTTMSSNAMLGYDGGDNISAENLCRKSKKN
jgi:hypothetical protein